MTDLDDPLTSPLRPAFSFEPTPIFDRLCADRRRHGLWAPAAYDTAMALRIEARAALSVMRPASIVITDAT